MATSLVQLATNTYAGSGIASLSANITGTPIAGDVLLVMFEPGSVNNVTSIAGCGATWRQIYLSTGPSQAWSNNTTIGIWVGTGANAAGNVTVSWSGSGTGGKIFAYHVRGLDNANAAVNVACTVLAGTSPTTCLGPSMPAGNGNQFVVDMIYGTNGGTGAVPSFNTPAPSSGWTNGTNYRDGTWGQFNYSYRTPSTSVTETHQQSVTVTGVATNKVLITQVVLGGTIAAPGGVAGLKAQWDASTLAGSDGSSVTTWADTSGNSRDLGPSQGTGGSAPILKTNQVGTKSIVRFDGTASELDTGIEAVTAVGYTVAGVIKYNASAGATNQMLWTAGFGSSAVGAGRSSSGSGATRGVARFNVSSNFGGGTSTSNWERWIVTSDGTQSKLYVNGTLVLTDVAAPGLPAGPMRLGATRQSGNLNISQPAPVDFGEVLVYDTALSSTDVTAVDTYLNTKWGIPVVTTTGAVGVGVGLSGSARMVAFPVPDNPTGPASAVTDPASTSFQWHMQNYVFGDSWNYAVQVQVERSDTHTTLFDTGKTYVFGSPGLIATLPNSLAGLPLRWRVMSWLNDDTTTTPWSAWMDFTATGHYTGSVPVSVGLTAAADKYRHARVAGVKARTVDKAYVRVADLDALTSDEESLVRVAGLRAIDATNPGHIRVAEVAAEFGLPIWYLRTMSGWTKQFYVESL